jgi:orotidine-5'-phosphate decarboxylase
VVSPVIVALDFPSIEEARQTAAAIKPHVGGFKVGLELLWAEGPTAVSEIAAVGLPVFADAKLHDIPNTVDRAARQLGRLGARWVTVHASGGPQVLEAAVTGLSAVSSESGVLAVTVLTSMPEDVLRLIGVDRGLGDQVELLSAVAFRSGAEGVVCSVPDVATAKRAGHLLVATPGIRGEGDPSHDQARVATARDALEAGADLLVVGRSITAAPDPVAAAAAIAEEVATATKKPPGGLTSVTRPEGVRDATATQAD